MFNWIHSLFHDPHKGWDPISADYAAGYQRIAHVDRAVIETFEDALGGLRGKAIADVGSGPGHYAMEFATRGANVTCIDVSANYLRMAERLLAESGYTARYALGYIDDINVITEGNFDAVFSNVAWCYCMNDYAFARELLRAVKPGGIVFTRQTNERWETARTANRRFAYFLNRHLKVKLGHLHPPAGRIAESFRRLNGCSVRTAPGTEAEEIVVARRMS